jgi:hypothetical protein
MKRYGMPHNVETAANETQARVLTGRMLRATPPTGQCPYASMRCSAGR